MGYHGRYQRALKFLRAPKQGVGSFVEAAHGTEIHPNNPHDAALADYLQDESDPRHLVVSGHLDRVRRGEDGYREELDRRGLRPDFTREHREVSGDGSLLFEHYHNPKTGDRATGVSWNVSHPAGLGARSYHALLNPHDAHSILADHPPSSHVSVEQTPYTPLADHP